MPSYVVRYAATWCLMRNIIGWYFNQVMFTNPSDHLSRTESMYGNGNWGTDAANKTTQVTTPSREKHKNGIKGAGEFEM